MPIYTDIKNELMMRINAHYAGERTKLLVIGELTDTQFSDINIHRGKEELPPLESKEVVYIGKHHHKSRSADGYLNDDLYIQIESSMHNDSAFTISRNKPHSTIIKNPNKREDGYGNMVNDTAILELTQRKPRAELFSVIPKGDSIKPKSVK